MKLFFNSTANEYISQCELHARLLHDLIRWKLMWAARFPMLSLAWVDHGHREWISQVSSPRKETPATDLPTSPVTMLRCLNSKLQTFR